MPQIDLHAGYGATGTPSRGFTHFHIFVHNAKCRFIISCKFCLQTYVMLPGEYLRSHALTVRLPQEKIRGSVYFSAGTGHPSRELICYTGFLFLSDGIYINTHLSRAPIRDNFGYLWNGCPDRGVNLLTWRYLSHEVRSLL